MHSSTQTSSLLRFHYGLLALSVTLIVLVTLYSTITVDQMRNSVDRVTHSIDAQSMISALLTENQNIEAYGLRYLLSGRDDYLRSYVQSTFTLEERINQMFDQVADNPEQIARLEELKAEAARRSEVFRSTIGDYQLQGLDAAMARIRGGEGADIITRIRALGLAMSQEEGRLLLERQVQLDKIIVQNNTTVLLVNGLALVAGLIAFFAIRRTGRALEARRMAVLHADQAERANREKSAFLASMSHEIRTPMNAVFGFSQLLARTKVEPKALDYIKAIQTSGETLLALINDILDLSRIEAGKMRLEPVSTDVRELLDSTLGVFAEAVSRKGLALDVRVAERVPARMVIDPHRFRQVLINLMSNAVKYTEHGRIGVVLDALPDAAGRHCALDLEVIDTGIGIAADKQAELFDPFYRAVHDNDSPSGSGLGLAIVERLVKLMNGRIDFDSEFGHGSRFRVRLDQVPVATDLLDASLHEDAAAQPVSPLPQRRILVVDDIAWNRDLLAAMLAENGDHEVCFAADGAQAVAAVVRSVPDLVLMDLRMPVMDGYEACRRIREQFPERGIRIVAVSASGMQAGDTLGGAQFDAYLRKPLTRESLSRTLAGLLGDVAQETAAVESSQQMQTAEARQLAIQRLQQLVMQDLPDIQAAMRVREVRALAEELIALGESGGLHSVQRFGHGLLDAAEAFDTGMMESLLQQMPAWVEELSGQAWLP